MPKRADYSNTSLLAHVRHHLKPWLPQPMVVAFSGGIDSTVLLHLLVALRAAGLVNHLTAVHVHHGLSPQADDWASHCQAVCRQWAVPLRIATVQVATNARTGLEQAARTARYRAFQQLLPAGACLLQGHHQADQAETVLFRLCRGTGIAGLAGIPLSRPLAAGWLVRPLLATARTAIAQYATRAQLPFIQEASNDDQRFARNYLRHTVLPLIEQRWPGAAARLAALAADVTQVNVQQDAAIAAQAQAVIVTRPQWLLGPQPLVHVPALQALPAVTGQQVIRYWLQQQGLPVPNRALLTRIFTELIAAKPDATPLLCWSGCQLRRYQGVLVANRPLPVTTSLVTPVPWDWQTKPKITLPGIGSLQVTPWQQAEGPPALCFKLPPDRIDIRWRATVDPAYRCALVGHTGRKTLKRWLQVYHIPPWLRGRVPLLFYRDHLIGVSGLWVGVGFQAEPPTGVAITWQPRLA